MVCFASDLTRAALEKHSGSGTGTSAGKTWADTAPAVAPAENKPQQMTPGWMPPHLSADATESSGFAKERSPSQLLNLFK